jgi:hypothetical protein
MREGRLLKDSNSYRASNIEKLEVKLVDALLFPPTPGTWLYFLLTWSISLLIRGMNLLFVSCILLSCYLIFSSVNMLFFLPGPSLVPVIEVDVLKRVPRLLKNKLESTLSLVII